MFCFISCVNFVGINFLDMFFDQLSDVALNYQEYRPTIFGGCPTI